MLLPHTRLGRCCPRPAHHGSMHAWLGGERATLSALVGLDLGRVGGGDVVLSIIDATTWGIVGASSALDPNPKTTPVSPGSCARSMATSALTLLVPTELAPAIIGPRGSAVRRISGASGARVHLSDHIDAYDDRKCTISGAPNKCWRHTTLCPKRCASPQTYHHPRRHRRESSCLTRHRSLASILPRCTKSGAAIASTAAPPPAGKERLLTITARAETQVSRAVRLIVDALAARKVRERPISPSAGILRPNTRTTSRRHSAPLPTCSPSCGGRRRRGTAATSRNSSCTTRTIATARWSAASRRSA